LPRRRRRVQDKWRIKNWYNINSPSYFGEVYLGSAPSDDPTKMIGRVIEKTLYDLTDDFSQQHLKLFFKVVNVKEDECSTIFNGHEYSREYLRGLVRRRSTRIDDVLNVNTKDDYQIRVSVVVISAQKAKTSQSSEVRKIIQSVLDEKARSLNFEQFVREAVLGKIASDIYNVTKKVIPVRHVGLRKTKLIAFPIEETVEEIVEAK
jgi:small subunit ribosomal protein S3Ae